MMNHNQQACDGSHQHPHHHHQQQQQQPQQQQGTQLNDWLLGPVLGIGTYGEVRSAIHKETGQQVALKMVDLSRFRSDTASLMLREVNIVRKLDHPNIIKVLDVTRDEPFSGTFCTECACTVFRRNKQNPTICLSCAHDSTLHKAQQVTKPMLVISQELAPGGELFSILMHGGALPEPVCRHYFAQLLASIEHCHSREVIHRDIKPENIVFDRMRRLKLVDFGLAACLDDKPEGSIERTLSVLHSGVGSKPYSAPEVSYTREMYNATGYKGKPADIWSCAVVLFVMLTGRPPFYRPLLKTFNQNLVKCKHFARIIKGQGYEGVPPLARDLLMQLFKLNPDDRLSIADIRKHPWMTQQFDGPFGALPVAGVDSVAECDDVLQHETWVMHNSAQSLAMQVLMGDPSSQNHHQQQNPNHGKTQYNAAGVDYWVDDTITYNITGNETELQIARRRAYQHLCGWMLQRVRIAWDHMQRPDMVYALETAFQHDEKVALQQAQYALQEQLAASSQHHYAYNSDMRPVFGVPPSPVVLPNQTPQSMPQQFAISSPAHNIHSTNNNGTNNYPQRSLHSGLTQHTMNNNSSMGGAMPVPINNSSNNNSNNVGVDINPIPLSFPTQNNGNNMVGSMGAYQQQQQQQQSRQQRDVAATPLQQSIVSSMTPGFSPQSPAVFGKMGSVPNFGTGQYMLNNNQNGMLPPQYLQQQQQQQQPQQSPHHQTYSLQGQGSYNGNSVMGNSSFLPQQQQQQQQQQYYMQQQQQQQQQVHQQQGSYVMSQHPQQFGNSQQPQQTQPMGGLSAQLRQHRIQQQQQQQQQPQQQQQYPPRQ